MAENMVVWNMNFIVPYIGNVIIPSDFHIFQRGRYTQPVIESADVEHI